MVSSTTCRSCAIRRIVGAGYSWKIFANQAIISYHDGLYFTPSRQHEHKYNTEEAKLTYTNEYAVTLYIYLTLIISRPCYVAVPAKRASRVGIGYLQPGVLIQFIQLLSSQYLAISVPRELKLTSLLMMRFNDRSDWSNSRCRLHLAPGVGLRCSGDGLTSRGSVGLCLSTVGDLS